MFRLSVCIEAVFAGRQPAEALKLVREAGLDAFEFWSWWDKDLEALDSARRELGLHTAALCTRFISLVDAGERERYLAGLQETISVSKRLGCSTIITQVGAELPGVPREAQRASLVAGLKACAPLLERERRTLVFEPLNTLVDHKGYFLWSSEAAFAIAAEVGSPWVKVLYDTYHQQIMEGHLIARLRKNIAAVGHLHAAGNPGRHELTRGEINHAEVFRALAEAGYQGFVGLEYWPVGDAVASLREAAAMLPQGRMKDEG